MLHKVLACPLVLMAAALVWTHLDGPAHTLALPEPVQTAAGFAIGVVAPGFAGGELLIPTVVLLYGIDIKLTGSLSLAVSLPHARRVRPLQPRLGLHRLRRNGRLVIAMTAGSIAGTLTGALFLGRHPNHVLITALALLLLVSAAKLGVTEVAPKPVSAGQ